MITAPCSQLFLFSEVFHNKKLEKNIIRSAESEQVPVNPVRVHCLTWAGSVSHSIPQDVVIPTSRGTVLS